MTNNHYYYY